MCTATVLLDCPQAQIAPCLGSIIIVLGSFALTHTRLLTLCRWVDVWIQHFRISVSATSCSERFTVRLVLVLSFFPVRYNIVPSFPICYCASLIPFLFVIVLPSFPICLPFRLLICALSLVLCTAVGEFAAVFAPRLVSMQLSLHRGW